MGAYGKLLALADAGPLTKAQRDLWLMVCEISRLQGEVAKQGGDPYQLDSSLRIRRLEYDLEAALDSGDEDRLRRVMRRYRDAAIEELLAAIPT